MASVHIIIGSIGLIALGACGGDGGGTGGSGGAAGVEPCASAQTHIDGQACAEDPDAFPEKYQLDLETCAGEDKLCANCIENRRSVPGAGCVLTGDCKEECWPIRS